jgi:hypothetical protein
MPSDTPGAAMSLRTVGIWLALVAAAAVILGIVWWRIPKPGRVYTPAPLSFDGSSKRLSRTVVLPTLDSPIPEGKSAIWCLSFQLAWNRLKADAAKGPIQLANAQPLADLLNAAEGSEADIGAGDFYAAAGFAKDGIVEQIQKEMASQFPQVPAAQFAVPAEGAVAYGYLAASARFDLPFFDNSEPLLFTDAAGNQTALASFGIRKKDEYAYRPLREQIHILYCSPDSTWRGMPIPEFILDPCKTSDPYQILIARLNRKATLAETLADIEARIAAQPESTYSQFHLRDTLKVPNLAFRIVHRFAELEGPDKQLLHPSLTPRFLDTALQTLQFRLDRSGAELWSEAGIVAKPGDSHFEVNRPFLVIMRKRGGKQPFFVAWIDNAELLQAFAEER